MSDYTARALGACHDYYEHHEKLMDIAEDTIEKKLEKVSKEPKKETAGKPEGARYFFLESLACLHNVDNLTSELGTEIKQLVDVLEERIETSQPINNKRLVIKDMIDFIIDEYNTQYGQSRLLDDLIKLRYDTISTGKYTINSYKELIDISLLLDAMARHYIKMVLISSVDEESGCLHLSHIIANLLIIDIQLQLHGDNNDK